ncbi:hypothetical protein INS49_006565 [Diaporthe citri]|uniref:uncharacterized protein n=1 Tax=Diaporthe citri TaxID=83186 RepID=UPI001C822E36|nr:uncharacterized protein INS49_006565 [Diaporthe citri]KAG6364960.1 hypothetical protein INS49_006565 [Diaporthe citri]
MISRKRARRGGGAPGPTSSTTSLQPTRASTSSQVSDLSAAPVTSPSPSASEPPQGMPPPALRQLDTSSKSLKSDSSAISVQEGNKTVHKTRSCPLKAGSTPDFSRFESKRTGDAASLSGASQASVNTMPKVRETDTDGPATKDDATATVQEAQKNNTNNNDATSKDAAEDAKKDGSKGNVPPAVDVDTHDTPPAADTPQRPSTSSGWLGGWFTSNPVPEKKPTENENTLQENATSPKEENAQSNTEPPPENNTVASGAAEQPAPTAPQRSMTMWLPFWSSSSAPAAGNEEAAKATESNPAPAKEPEDTVMDDAPPANPEPATKPTAGSTWAFWSKDTPKSPGEPKGTTEHGELAVMGDGSEAHPKRANSLDMGRDASPKPEPPKEAPGKIKQIKDKVSKEEKKQASIHGH